MLTYFACFPILERLSSTVQNLTLLFLNDRNFIYFNLTELSCHHLGYFKEEAQFWIEKPVLLILTAEKKIKSYAVQVYSRPFTIWIFVRSMVLCCDCWTVMCCPPVPLHSCVFGTLHKEQNPNLCGLKCNITSENSHKIEIYFSCCFVS